MKYTNLVSFRELRPLTLTPDRHFVPVQTLGIRLLDPHGCVYLYFCYNRRWFHVSYQQLYDRLITSSVVVVAVVHCVREKSKPLYMFS